jgi:flavin reductase (DIM6/NTAB) family NADH-FMN oxidoreductase RutF
MQMIFDFAELQPIDRYKLLSSTITPRPIAWVSTVSAQGKVNAAPFSFFNVFSEDPPVVGFSVNDRRPGDRKDTGNNVRAVGDFVVNLVTEALGSSMNVTAAEFRPEVDEFAEAGLTAGSSLRVKSPRILESPVSFECRLMRIVELGPSRSLVLGEVVLMHVNDAFIRDAQRYHIDTPGLRVLGRMQGNSYVRIREVFEMARHIPEPGKTAV